MRLYVNDTLLVKRRWFCGQIPQVEEVPFWHAACVLPLIARNVEAQRRYGRRLYFNQAIYRRFAGDVVRQYVITGGVIVERHPSWRRNDALASKPLLFIVQA